MEWYKIFSYWAWIFWALWMMKLSPISPWLILTLSMAGTIVFLGWSYDSPKPVALFIFFTHLIPLIISRNDPMEFHGTMAIIIFYIIFLKFHGTNPKEVYTWVLENPPQTVHEYLERRGLINNFDWRS